MKLEDQVCSLELAKRLKELGVKQVSYFYWIRINGAIERYVVYVGRDQLEQEISAFTVTELGEMLPCKAEIVSRLNFKFAGTIIATKEAFCWNLMQSEEFPYHWIKADTEADARAKMLIYLIEKGLVKP